MEMNGSQTQQHLANQASSPSDFMSDPLQSDRPAKKRKRTGRACDDCRLMKIKCNGKNPCEHCINYGYHCSYDRPSNRKRNPTKETQLLESKLQRMQKLLEAVVPGVDVNDPSVDASELSKLRTFTTQEEQSIQKPQTDSGSSLLLLQRSGTGEDATLETILEVNGQLDLDEHGNWDYHGHSSGSAFLRLLGEYFGNLHSNGLSKNTLLKLHSAPQIFETLGVLDDDPLGGCLPTLVPLPPKETAFDLVSSTLDDACALISFVHQPSFYRMFHRMYSIDFEDYGHKEKEFLPLLYAVLALGYLFSKNELENFGYAHSASQGAKYFVACRRMFNLAECRDLSSLQAVVFMIMFLQSSGKMSTCYTYIGTALAASLHMGLHRHDDSQVLDPVERETRKRIFWTIRSMETYVVAILGLPKSINDEDIDQEIPLEVDDEYITEEGVLQMPEGQISTLAGFNAHTKLLLILAKVVRNVYPTRRGKESTSGRPSTYIVSDASIRSIEGDLVCWAATLPSQLRPSLDSPPKLLRIQHLLQMALCHVRMVLYRPFLHYISRSRAEAHINRRCYTYASASVSVGRNIIRNAKDMKIRNIFNGPYWFSIYTIFFATISLTFYAWENLGVQDALKTLKDAESGREMLANLAYRSMAAARCSTTLETIFSQLPERLRESQRITQAGTSERRLPPRKATNPQESSVVQGPDTLYDSFESLQRENSSSETDGPTPAEDMLSDGTSSQEGAQGSAFPTNSSGVYSYNPPIHFSTPEAANNSVARSSCQLPGSNNLSYSVPTIHPPPQNSAFIGQCERGLGFPPGRHECVRSMNGGGSGDDGSDFLRTDCISGDALEVPLLYPLSSNLTHTFPYVLLWPENIPTGVQYSAAETDQSNQVSMEGF